MLMPLFVVLPASICTEHYPCKSVCKGYNRLSIQKPYPNSLSPHHWFVIEGVTPETWLHSSYCLLFVKTCLFPPSFRCHTPHNPLARATQDGCTPRRSVLARDAGICTVYVRGIAREEWRANVLGMNWRMRYCIVEEKKKIRGGCCVVVIETPCHWHYTLVCLCARCSTASRGLAVERVDTRTSQFPIRCYTTTSTAFAYYTCIQSLSVSSHP